jgi:argininosuccinate lyase
MKSLTDKARETVDLIMPGYTHLQRAQPVRVAHHLLAYYEMFHRDWERFTDSRRRIDSMPLGSAALAGATYDIDREFVAKELGFTKVSANSLDSVSDRDFVAECIFDCSLVMTHLSRLAEELIVWEVG